MSDYTDDDVTAGMAVLPKEWDDTDKHQRLWIVKSVLAAVAPQIAARARGHWWITDGPLRLAKSTKLLGPFPTQDLALIVRTYVERCEGHNRLWVDEEAVV